MFVLSDFEKLVVGAMYASDGATIWSSMSASKLLGSLSKVALVSSTVLLPVS